MRRWALVTFVPLLLVTLAMTRTGTAQDSSFATSASMPTRGPIPFADGVTIEPITRMPLDPRAHDDFSVGLQRIVIQPGAVLDAEAVLGHGYSGPVQFYVERGVMTITKARDQSMGFSSNSVTGMRFPAEGEIDVPADVAVYVQNGEIGPVRNDGPEELVILALLIVPDRIDAEDVIGTAVPAEMPST